MKRRNIVLLKNLNRKLIHLFCLTTIFGQEFLLCKARCSKKKPIQRHPEGCRFIAKVKYTCITLNRGTKETEGNKNNKRRCWGTKLKKMMSLRVAMKIVKLTLNNNSVKLNYSVSEKALSEILPQSLRNLIIDKYGNMLYALQSRLRTPLILLNNSIKVTFEPHKRQTCI